MQNSQHDKLIAYFALYSGLSISAVAVYYSVAGLISIFAAAVIPIMIMGIVLESSKLVATVWLKQYWHIAPSAIRYYLASAVAILMLITSMGIFGYMSKAHLEQTNSVGDITAKIAVIDDKIATAEAEISRSRAVLVQLDAAVTQTLVNSTNDTGGAKANRVRQSQAGERATLNKTIKTLQSTVASLKEEKIPIEQSQRQVEAEVGPIKYIAALIYGDNPDSNLLERAVRWMIILIVIVFDPLAVMLLLASQYSFAWLRTNDKNPPDTPPSIEPLIPDIPPEEPKVEPEIPPIPDIKPDIIAEPKEKERPISELHPYLLAPTSHFTNLKPMVSKPVPPEEKVNTFTLKEKDTSRPKPGLIPKTPWTGISAQYAATVKPQLKTSKKQNR